MLKTLLVTTLVCASFTLPIKAEDEKPQDKPARRAKGQLTEEQRTLMKELRDKYDTNKDGKLDGAERKAMSAEDKEKLSKAGLGPRKKKAE